MAILNAAPRQRSRRTEQDRDVRWTEATTWSLDLVDVDVSAVRRFVAAELVSDSCWSQVRSLADGGYRRVSPVEALLWTEQVVSTADVVRGDLALAHALGAAPLERLPFAVVVTPDAVVLRWHRAVASHGEAQLLLRRLVSAAGRSGVLARLA